MEKHYTVCSVDGMGRLKHPEAGYEHDFRIVEVSASGIRITTAADIEVESLVNLDMRFGAHFIEKELAAAGEVLKKRRLGSQFEYRIKFVGLKESKKVEIDEALKRTCNPTTIGYFKGSAI